MLEIPYNGFSTGINIINKKKIDKRNISNISIGFLILPSNVVYPQPYNGYYPKKGPNYVGLLFITKHPKYQ